jgi:hypothetical protein
MKGRRKYGQAGGKKREDEEGKERKREKKIKGTKEKESFYLPGALSWSIKGWCKLAAAAPTWMAS